MAQVMLKLSKPVFRQIGALVNDSGQWKVFKRPLTLNMSELLRVGNIPPSKFTRDLTRQPSISRNLQHSSFFTSSISAMMLWRTNAIVRRNTSRAGCSER